MSQENVEVARRFNCSAASKAEMLAALPAMVALCDPEVEWTQRGRETPPGARRAISGAEVRSQNYELLTIRDRLIVRYREFYDEREALEAAGLSV